MLWPVGGCTHAFAEKVLTNIVKMSLSDITDDIKGFGNVCHLRSHPPSQTVAQASGVIFVCPLNRSWHSLPPHCAIATAPPPLPCRLASSATPTSLSRRVNWTRCKATSRSFRNSTRASMVATWRPQARKRRRGASPAPGTAPGGAATRPAAGARSVSTGRTPSARRSSRSPCEVGDARHASPRSSSSSTPPCRCPVPTPRRRGASRLLSAYARSLWVWVRKSHPSVWLPVMGRLCHRRAASDPHDGGTTRTTACCTRRPPI